MIDQPGKNVVPGSAPLTVQRLVTSWQYLWTPVPPGLAMALCLAILIEASSFPRDAPRRRP